MDRKRILIIEDEPEQVKALGIRLQANNYDVSTASDGEAGYRKAVAERPDLIIMDVLMPGMDGLTLCRRLREIPETKGIPLVVLSASGAKEVAKRCIVAGASDYMSKPYESKELLALIGELLGTESGERRA